MSQGEEKEEKEVAWRRGGGEGAGEGGGGRGVLEEVWVIMEM